MYKDYPCDSKVWNSIGVKNLGAHLKLYKSKTHVTNNGLLNLSLFHCDVKPFAYGTGICLDTQHDDFALPIPTCWHLKTLEMTCVR